MFFVTLVASMLLVACSDNLKGNAIASSPQSSPILSVSYADGDYHCATPERPNNCKNTDCNDDSCVGTNVADGACQDRFGENYEVRICSSCNPTQGGVSGCQESECKCSACRVYCKKVTTTTTTTIIEVEPTTGSFGNQ